MLSSGSIWRIRPTVLCSPQISEVSSLALYKNKEIKQYQSKNYNRQTAANRGRTRQFRRIFVYDKSIICVPRQEFLFCLICLVFCGFSHNKRCFTTSLQLLKSVPI